jgi:4-hydroxybenzoate polyprenyltransferase
MRRKEFFPMSQPFQVAQPQMANLPKYLLISMRPKQWFKNVFVFAGFVFANEILWNDINKIALVVSTFLLWCLISSSIYLINDLVDIPKDRQHPKKRYRPLASGHLARSAALTATLIFLGVGLPLAWLLSWKLAIIYAAYVVMQLAYSFRLKHVVIVDVFIIAAGFVMRTVSGAVVLNITISHWLLICTGLLSLFLALAKRRHELVLLENGSGSHRRVLDDYSTELVQEMISIITASTIIAYILYTLTPSNPHIPVKPFPLMLVTVPFVVYAIFRYLYLVYKKDEGGSTEEMLLRDWPLLLDIFLWGVTVMIILYVYRQ